MNDIVETMSHKDEVSFIRGREGASHVVERGYKRGEG